MPMSGAILGADITAAINGLSAAQKSDISAVWNVIGAAIVKHIQTQAVVATTGTAATQTGTVT